MRKKIMFFTLLIGILNICTPLLILNASPEKVIINNNNAKITEKQFDVLKQRYDEEAIMWMSQNIIDSRSSENRVEILKAEKFYNVAVVYDKFTNEYITYETEITEEEYNNSEIEPMSIPPTDNPTVETNSKKLQIWVLRNSQTRLYEIDMRLDWKTDPVVKSHDVLAARWNNKFIMTNVEGYCASCEGQVFNNNSPNFKKASNGVGLSIKLNGYKGQSFIYIDGRMQMLPNEFHVWGTYQHAISSVTFTESQSYNFGDGIGGVLLFNTTISNKYDKMSGVSLNLTGLIAT